MRMEVIASRCGIVWCENALYYLLCVTNTVIMTTIVRRRVLKRNEQVACELQCNCPS